VYLGLWFLFQLIVASLGASQCRAAGGRVLSTSAGFIFGLLAAGGAAAADLPPPSGRLTISAALAKMATVPGYRAWPR
jgi:hypothetical protein